MSCTTELVASTHVSLDNEESTGIQAAIREEMINDVRERRAREQGPKRARPCQQRQYALNIFQMVSHMR